MKVKAKNFFYEFLPSAKDKKKLLAEQGTSMSPGPKIPGLRNSIKGLPNNYFDFFDQKDIIPNTKGIETVPTYDPNIPSPAEGITPPGLPGTPPGMITTEQNPQMPKKGGNIGNALLFGAAAFDALLPNQVQKQQVVQPQEMYNPYKYGTGSQALMQQGGQVGTATTQDSLDIYNNTNALLKYYKDRNYRGSSGVGTDYKGTNYDFFAVLDRDRYDFDQSNNLGATTFPTKGGKSGIGKIDRNMYYRPIDSNRFYQRESASAILDTRAPMGLYDKRIIPTSHYSFNNNIKGDALENDQVSIFGYDPIDVKPYNMLTPEERKIRDARYPKNGQSVLSKSTYKKPTKAPEDRNIAPTNVRDISPSQRGKVEGRGYHEQNLSQKPTKFSATYRDESSPSKDRTVYFKDKDSWRAAVQSGHYSPVSTEERVDSATAAGYKMQTGGSIETKKYKGYPAINANPNLANPDSFPMFHVEHQAESPLYSTSDKRGNYIGVGADIPGANAYLDAGLIRYPGEERGTVNLPSVSGAYSTPVGDFGLKYNPENKLSATYSKRFQDGGNVGFYEEYMQSPKYRERLTKQSYKNPDSVIKDRLSNVRGIKTSNTDTLSTQYLPDSNTVALNRDQLEGAGVPRSTAKAHEFAHGAGARGFFQTQLENRPNLGMNVLEENEFSDRNRLNRPDTDGRFKSLTSEQRSHDGREFENKADLDTLRYLLKKDGIYDTGTQDFDKNHLNEAKKRYSKDPVTKRLFDYFGDDDLIYLMNNIAGGQRSTPNAYTGAQIMSVERDYPIIIPEGVEDNMPSAKSGNWIQGAVNPKHKGYCTPMTKKTCTPRRKALARTFKKHHGFHENGGIIPDPMSNFNPHRYAEGGNVNGGANIRMVGPDYPNSDLLEQWLLYKQGGEVGPNYPNTDLLEQWIPWRTGEYQQGGTVGPNYPNTDLLEQWIPWMTGDYAVGGQLGPAKAKEMLRDGTAHGKKLTARQKRYFGFIAGGGKAQQGAVATRDPYYEANARLLHYKTVLNDKLKTKNPQAFGDYFKGLKDVRMKGQGADDYIQKSQYNEYLSPDEVKGTLGENYGDYLNSLKAVNTYNVQQGQQPLYGQVEGEKDVNSLNYGRRFASLQVNPSLSVHNETRGTNYSRNYTYNPKTKRVDFKEEGDLSIRPSYLAAPQTSAALKEGGSINSTGYMYGHSTANNDYNIIPSQHITMKGVKKPIMGRAIRKGQMGEEIMMSPGGEYTFPGADGVFEYPMYQDGGEIGTMWGGNAEMESYNPYDGGTVAFNGASHDDGGIGMHYNGQPVEVEGGEYASQDNEGNLNIYGNMYLPGTRTKFKSVAKAMAKKEKRYDFLKTHGSELVNKTNPADRYEVLKFNAGKVMMEGGRIGQKDIAEKKQKLSALQKAMLETAKEHGLDAQELSAGKIKKDKSKGKAVGGGLIPFAQDGAVTDPTMADRNNNPGNLKWGEFARKKGAKKGAPAPDGGFYAVFPDQKSGLGAMKDLLTSKGYKDLSIDQAISKWTGGKPYNYNLDDISGKRIKDLSPQELDRTLNTMRQGEGTKYPIRSSTPQGVPKVPRGTVDAPPFTPYDLPGTPPFKTEDKKTPNKTIPPPLDSLQIPQRPDMPSNVEPLHMNQVLGELYGAATNRQEPVVAQKYEPQLYSPYQVSFQDRLNKNEKTFNSLQRSINDPGILSGVAAQKYEADNAIKGEEFRTNQGIANDIINKNVALSNDATLKNLGIADNQYVRQSTAKSKTKQMNQVILNSISSKYAQNDLQNKRLAAYENLYDYRFVPTKSGGQKATYFGPNAQFNFDPQQAAGRQQQDIRRVSRYDQYGNPKGYTEYDESQLEDARKQIDYEMKRRKLPLLEAPQLD